jgi:hypothetical protein
LKRFKTPSDPTVKIEEAYWDMIWHIEFLKQRYGILRNTTVKKVGSESMKS